MSDTKLEPHADQATECCQEQQLVHKIIDLNPYGMVLTDAEGRLVRTNQASRELFGLPDDQTAAASYCLFEDPVVLRAGFGEVLQQLRQGKEVPPIELWYTPHDVDPRCSRQRICLKTTMFPLHDDAGRLKNIVLMHENITARKQAEELYRRREAILEAIAASAQRFLSTPSWRNCMEEVLADIGRAAGASRAYLFVQADSAQLSCCWTEDSTRLPAPDFGPSRNGRSPFARWKRLLREDHIVQGCLQSFPRNEQAALNARGIQSVLQIPVFVEGQWWGFLGFDDCRQPREWSEGEIAALRTLAGLLGSTVQRQNAERALQEANERLEARVAERTAELTAVNGQLREQIEARQASEARLQVLVDHIPVMVTAMDASGLAVIWNKEAERITGYAADEMIGNPRVLELLYPDPLYREALVKEWTGRNYGLQDFRVRLTCKDGSVRTVAWSSRADTVAIPGCAAWGVAVDVTEQVLAEEKLSRSEARLRAIIDALPDLVFILDEDGRYIDILAGDDRLPLGPASKLKGRHVHNFFAAQQADLILQVIRRTIETGQSQSHEYQVQGPRAVHWHEARTAPLQEEVSGKRCVIWVARDVTQRKQALEALEESEAKFRTLVDNLNVGVNRVAWYPRPRCVHANQALAQIFGYDSLEEFMKLSPPERFRFAKDRRHMRALLTEKGSVRNYEVKIRRKDGSEAIVSSTCKAHFDSKGRIDYLDGIIEDITARKQAEDRLHLLSHAVEQSTEGIGVADIRGRILFVNQAFAAMHGLNRDQVIGQHIGVFHTPEQMRVASKINRTVVRKGPFRGVVWHVRRDGEPFPALMNVSLLRSDSGQAIGFVATALDISGQLESEAERQMLARAVENAGEGIGILNKSWTLTYANTALASILGRRKPADILGRQWESLCEPVPSVKHTEIVTAVGKKARWAGRATGACPDGRTVPLALTLARMAQAEGENLIVANVRDRSAEEDHLAQIRKVTRDAARALEDERARLSRELHDELGQTLTAINLDLAWLASRSQDWGTPAQERLNEVKLFVNRMLDSVRSLSTSLRPPILDNRGLLEAMRSYAAEFARRAGISCRVVAVPSDLEVHDPLATTVFRIFQEAMTNVARHSRANKCGIFLRLTGPNLELRIRDSGVGAVPKRLEGVQSLGIAGMRERAARAGGTLTVENRPEGGVCVTARLPWRQAYNGTRND